MKQHITDAQLEELSTQGKKNYFKWIMEDKCYVDLYYANVGVMIEFLDEHDSRLLLSKANGEVWIVGFSTASARDERPHGRELVDALWEAVKEILEK